MLEECGDGFILGVLSSLTSRTPVLQGQSANLALCFQPPTRGYALFGPYTCFWEQTGTEEGLGGGSRDLAGAGLLLRRGLKAPLWHHSGVISEERSGARIEGWIWNPSSSCPCLSFLLVGLVEKHWYDLRYNCWQLSFPARRRKDNLSARQWPLERFISSLLLWTLNWESWKKKWKKKKAKMKSTKMKSDEWKWSRPARRNPRLCFTEVTFYYVMYSSCQRVAGSTLSQPLKCHFISFSPHTTFFFFLSTMKECERRMEGDRRRRLMTVLQA